jgi:hypothetical protein
VVVVVAVVVVVVAEVVLHQKHACAHPSPLPDKFCKILISTIFLVILSFKVTVVSNYILFLAIHVLTFPLYIHTISTVFLILLTLQLFHLLIFLFHHFVFHPFLTTLHIFINNPLYLRVTYFFPFNPHFTDITCNCLCHIKFEYKMISFPSLISAYISSLLTPALLKINHKYLKILMSSTFTPAVT